MEQSKTKQSHTLATFLYSGSKALERASYYGLRSLIIIYMIGETLQMEREEALIIYGWFTGIIVVTQLLGAIIGDLVIGNKYAAFIGGILQAIGAFLLCFPSEIMLYAAIALISLGSGFYGPNLFSLFGKLFYKREKVMDSGFTLFYIAMNIGAFVGAFLIGYVAENNYNFGFITAGVLMLLSVGLMFIVTEKSAETQVEIAKNSISITKKMVMILLAMAISSIFWMAYEFGGSDMFMIPYDLIQSSDSIFSAGFLSGVNGGSALLVGVIFIIVWLFVQMSRVLKLGIGFLLAVAAFGILLFIPYDANGLGVGLYIISGIFLGAAELLIAPTVLAILTKYTNPKYLATVFALSSIPLRLLLYITGLLSAELYDTPNTGLKIAMVILFIVGIALLIFSFISKINKATTEQVEQS